MGTLARIVLYAPSAEAARTASQHAFARIAALNHVMSDYEEDSELMKVCALAGRGPVHISDDLFRVLEASQRIAELSGGAFDVTAGPLTHLWRRARRLDALPEPERLQHALALTGYKKMALDTSGRTVVLQDAGMLLDVGGIGKGFAADEAIASLKKDGIDRALVAMGGDIFAAAAPPDADGWAVEISDTANPSGQKRSVRLRDAGISTSGDAEQFVEIAGRRYSHILDPRTGQALTGRRSVTIRASSATDSDSLATAVCVLGREAGERLVSRVAGAKIVDYYGPN
jgi:FAD:protein FMN transferase